MHRPVEPLELLVGPSTADQANTVRLRLIPLACWRVDDLRFRFDSSVVLPGIQPEMKRLAVPASVDSIPSSAMQEDHVSMGWSAARKLRRSVDGLTRVLAVELLTAARAIDLRAPLTPAPATAAVVRALREAPAGLDVRIGGGAPHGSAGRRSADR